MADHTPKRRRVNLRWVLAASLGLNLLFVGVFVGAAYRQAGGPGSHGDGAQMTRGYATPYVQALPRETRRALHQTLRNGDQAGARLSRKARRALYAQMIATLRATPFDPTAATDVLSAQRDAVLGVQSLAQSMWLKEVTDMTPDERAAYADKLEKILKRGPRRPDRRKKREE
ncbi:MAG: periplasmic heavy metal sensor [Sulfitobacter sp.]